MRTDAYAVLVDFGSTYTKVVVADLRQGDIVLTWREPSTVATDATVALTRCFAKCRDTIGGAAFEAARKLASSSAAGGLRMGVVGLSRSLSTTAGRNAAFGAGAKILGTFCGHLTKEDVAALSSLPLEIVLFCGGYDGGGVRTLRHNAEMLASSRLHIPFVYAGNTAAAADVRSIFGAAHKEIFVSHNITPCVGGMNSAPVAAVIRDLFLHRIINMKGLEKVVPLLDRVVMPTPAAVLAAGKLLAQGTNAVPGMGPLMIVDIGGATTSIPSFSRKPARVPGSWGRQRNLPAVRWKGTWGCASLPAACGRKWGQVSWKPTPGYPLRKPTPSWPAGNGNVPAWRKVRQNAASTMLWPGGLYAYPPGGMRGVSSVCLPQALSVSSAGKISRASHGS